MVSSQRIEYEAGFVHFERRVFFESRQTSPSSLPVCGLERSWGEEGKRRRGREERLEWSITPYAFE